MDLNFLNKKTEQNTPQNKGKKGKGKGNFSGSILGAVVFFMLITALYLVVSGDGKVTPQVSISELANSVVAGNVKTILVEGDKLTITYQNGDVKESKKEVGAPLTQTLFDYGVPATALAKTDIQVKDESGFMFFLINSLPLLLPIVFILLFFWYLLRQF